MNSLPYMPFYIADYLADTSHLTTLGHGAYMLLLMNYWQRGAPLPDDDRKLARIARVTFEEWASIRDDLAELFTIENGQWVQSRQERELDKANAKRASAKKAAAASAASRSGSKSTDAERTLNERSTDAERTFNHTDTDTDTTIASSLRSEACAAEVFEAEVVPEKPERKAAWWEESGTLITAHLNAVCGKRYSGIHPSLKARLKDASAADRGEVVRLCRLIIEHKSAEWGRSDKMREYLRPETLFARGHWESYTQAADAWDKAGRPRLDMPKPPRNGKAQSVEDVLALSLGVA